MGSDKMTGRKNKTAAVVLAAGSGRRMGSSTKKQYMLLDGRPIIYYSLEAFERSPLIDTVILVTGKDEIEYCRREIKEKFSFDKIKEITAGGAERYDSVYMGLCSCPTDTDIVFIHDGARPFVTEDMIARAYEDACTFGACTVGIKTKDTVRIADSCGTAAVTPDRDRVWQIQTPQVFDFAAASDSYKKLEENKKSLEEQGVKITDDAMVVEMYTGVKPHMTEGAYCNIKITTPEDLIFGEALIKADRR